MWQCFLSFYLDEAQHPIQACYEYTEMWIKREAPQLLPLPAYASFYRKVQTAIPKPVEIMGRQGMKAFRDRCAPYIRRTYEGMASNEWWIADNHTFDVQTKGENGSIHRLYLTAFLMLVRVFYRLLCDRCTVIAGYIDSSTKGHS